MESFKKYLSEFIGTMCLVIFGCGAMSMTDVKIASMGYLMAALAFGLTLIAMEYTVGRFSGCHLNPAVSLALFISRKIDLIDFIGYTVFQILGGVAGAAVLFVVYGDGCGFGANNLTGVDGSVVKALFIEFLLSFVFILAVLASKLSGEKTQISGALPGIALTLVYIIGIGLTGGSVNPARSIGPALLCGGSALTSLWIFIVSPLAAGALAALAYKFLFAKKSASAVAEGGKNDGGDDENGEESDDETGEETGSDGE